MVHVHCVPSETLLYKVPGTDWTDYLLCISHASIVLIVGSSVNPIMFLMGEVYLDAHPDGL